MFDQLIFPTDGSDTATVALGVGIDVANAAGAALHVLSVVDTEARYRRAHEHPDRGIRGEREPDRRGGDEVRGGGGRRLRVGGSREGVSVHRTIRSYVRTTTSTSSFSGRTVGPASTGTCSGASRRSSSGRHRSPC